MNFILQISREILGGGRGKGSSTFWLSSWNEGKFDQTSDVYFSLSDSLADMKTVFQKKDWFLQQGTHKDCKVETEEFNVMNGAEDLALT